jgi:hypothetical protein
MQKFKEFIVEALDQVIDIDAKHLEGNMERINADFDAHTEKPYQNAPIFLNQLRGVMERYGLYLPASATAQFLNLTAELVYKLGETDYHLYVVYDTNDDGYVDGYAQIVTADELDDLMSMDMDDVVNSDRNMIAVRHSDWYRKRDDDAGNSDEY